MKPAVSVVIPTYKRPADLQRAVRSALDQTFADIEILVVIEPDDDHALPALAVFDDARLRPVMSPAKRGSGVARDTGADAALADWVAFLDDDDEWLPQRLEKQMGDAPDPECEILMTQSLVIGPGVRKILPSEPYDNEQPIDEWMFDRRTWFGKRTSMIQTSSLIVPRALLQRLRFGTDQHEEWEFIIRAVKEMGYQLRTVEQPLVVFYVGRVYSWERSIRWIKKMSNVVTARAYSGFLLNVVSTGIPPQDRPRAFSALLRLAWSDGHPTAKQLFAFALVWLLPQSLRDRLRATPLRAPARG